MGNLLARHRIRAWLLSAGAAQAQVTGSGSGRTGRIPEWTASTVLGNSVINESAAGNIGIGAGAPPSKLTVLGSTTIVVQADNASTANYAYGVLGRITSTAPGAGSAGVRGINSSTGGAGYGVYGSQAGSGVGVRGKSSDGTGVFGFGGDTGVYGSGGDTGVYGSGDIYGIYGFRSGGHAGYFNGDVHVDGTLSKADGTLRLTTHWTRPISNPSCYLSR